jgi:hypothetical protein
VIPTLESGEIIKSVDDLCNRVILTIIIDTGILTGGAR